MCFLRATNSKKKNKKGVLVVYKLQSFYIKISPLFNIRISIVNLKIKQKKKNYFQPNIFQHDKSLHLFSDLFVPVNYILIIIQLYLIIFGFNFRSIFCGPVYTIIKTDGHLSDLNPFCLFYQLINLCIGCAHSKI